MRPFPGVVRDVELAGESVEDLSERVTLDLFVLDFESDAER